MLHEIINPSDKYTIECNDMALLTASIFALGEGKYGTASNDTDFEVPITIFGQNGVEFFREKFGIEFGDYVLENKRKIGECLGTIVLGSYDDRAVYLSSLEKIKDENEKRDFIAKWYNEHQTSENQIGQRALQISQILTQKGN